MEAHAALEAALARLTEHPEHFPDCCCAISLPLVSTLLDRLPATEPSPLVLSVRSSAKSDKTLHTFRAFPVC